MAHLPPATPMLAQPARGNPGAWFGADSYPAAALRRSAQGRAVARLAIDAGGRVTGCTIVSSSGDADLDRATCAIPLARGRFAPALTRDGVPLASSYTLPVRWVLPADGGPTSAAPGPERHQRGWFERVMAAHHLIVAATALFAFIGARVRRWLTPGADGPADGWPAGDRMPLRRRRPRWLPDRARRIAIAIGPAALLALALAWLGW